MSIFINQGYDFKLPVNPALNESNVAKLNKSINDSLAEKINPKHYQDIVPGMQYMKVMQYVLDGKQGVEAHLLGQVYKYLMRLGKKDPKEQDASKAKWYLDCLVKYYKTGEVDTNN